MTTIINIYSFVFLVVLPSFLLNVSAETIHKAYEMPVLFDKNTPQQFGTHLNGPGDNYRYTFILQDQYAKSDKYRISKATFGVHILDGDYHKDTGDSTPEWGKIIMDGEARKWITLPFLDKNYKLNKTSTLSKFYEIESDMENDGLPPYIFEVTDLIQDHNLRIEITNLRKDGSISGTSPFGGFQVLRVGLHVWWEKIE